MKILQVCGRACNLFCIKAIPFTQGGVSERNRKGILNEIYSLIDTTLYIGGTDLSMYLFIPSIFSRVARTQIGIIIMLIDVIIISQT